MESNTEHYFLFADKETLNNIGVENVEVIDLLVSVDLSEEQAEKLIPEGPYCYTRERGKFKRCPFWDMIEHIPSQSSGFCHKMKIGDFTKDGTFLLWDQVKCCGIKED